MTTDAAAGTSDFEANLEARARLFKALGHASRLLILNLLAEKSRHGEELAALLNLKPATISHHLTQLREAGLVDARKEQYYQVFTLNASALTRPLIDVVRLPQPGLAASVPGDAYRDKVIRTFFKHGRLKQIPAQLKKHRIVVEHIAETFEPGRRYTEPEVNDILRDFHEDVAQLRRDMVEMRLMRRERGIYQRIADED